MGKGTRILQTILKKQKVGELTLPDFNTYYKVIGQGGVGEKTSSFYQKGVQESGLHSDMG